MLTHGGKHRILVLTAMQTSIFAARFLRICSAANTVIAHAVIWA